MIHDWGSGLGMRYARLNPDNAAAMSFMDAVVPPPIRKEDQDRSGRLRGENSFAELCRREGISQGIYYKWSKDFMEAGKRRLLN